MGGLSPWDPLPTEQKEEACLLLALSPVSWTMSSTLNFLIRVTFYSELKFPEGLSGCAAHCVSWSLLKIESLQVPPTYAPKSLETHPLIFLDFIQILSQSYIGQASVLVCTNMCTNVHENVCFCVHVHSCMHMGMS